MKRRGFQFRPGLRRMFYTDCLALFLTGAVWARLNYLDEMGHAGESMRQWKTWLIAVHGLAAMVFMVLLGMTFVTHARRAWHGRANRPNGSFFLGVVCLVALSGYALYYAGNESVRAALSGFHFWLGLATPVLLLWHIRTGRRAVRQDKAL